MKLKEKRFGITTLLSLFALVVTTSVFFKAIIDVDLMWDTWVYHLPFAVRIWRIIPPELYLFESVHEHRFDGFTLLAEFLQGFFWFVTGHLQAANLVCFFSLILYIVFLKVYFQVPLYLSAIALLAIPLVLTHSTTCYVDLPGNIGISILILMIYLLYKQNNFPTKWDLGVIFLAAASASNIKLQLEPIVFLILCFIGIRIVWLRWRQTKADKTQWLLKTIPIALVASLLIFATPIKNIALYGNPFYPVKFEIAGRVLNHKLGLYSQSPDYLKEAPRAQRWLYSILEINSPNWTVDQFSLDKSKNRMGGFFGAYVVFNLILFGYITWRDLGSAEPRSDRCRETTVAFIVLVTMSAVAANFPQSHELRYFMYWMISLVSLNLCLLSHDNQVSSFSLQLLKPKYSGLAYAFFLAIVLVKIGDVYAKPTSYTLDKHLQAIVQPKVLSKINPNEEVCIVGKQPYTFAYASPFHTQLGYSYSVKASGSADNCEGRRVVK
ncbi:hypothetical protein IQ238_09870 [Pleurocapsales cyanobacterium LEGE 06147]|nr:hypothetical protein [Pleurocapsales cyanobacterium LEGE 06147]